MLSSLKLYINPEIYKAERDLEQKEKEEKEKAKTEPKAKNLFEDISLRSSQDGVFRLPKELRDILNKQEQVKPKVEDEEDTLG